MLVGIVVLLLLQQFGRPIDAAETPRSKVEVAELSPHAERAIETGLKYLGRAQNRDGSWAPKYQGAVTSLALMSFMLKGHFPGQGEYGSALERAVQYLIRRSKDNGGYIGDNMYEHGLSALALSEVWGMSNREEIRDTLKQAILIILRSQAPSGGWRYEPRPKDADISVTVMQIVALSSAKEAGIYVPQKHIDRAIEYVKKLQVPFSGGFGYTSASEEGFARSAAGTMSLLMCGLPADDAAVRAGLSYLLAHPESKFDKEEYYYYGHYYAIQAVYQAGDAYYQPWYPKIHDALLKQQKDNGAWTGGKGGDEYSTAMAILILGVPYRFLPIYQR